MIVLDASAALELLLGRRPGAETIASTMAGEPLVHAPHLLHTEVLHSLRRLVARRELSPPRAQAALERLAELPLLHHPHQPLSLQVWALRDRFTAYDATYLALAASLSATLVTADRKLARGAAGIIDAISP